MRLYIYLKCATYCCFKNIVIRYGLSFWKLYFYVHYLNVKRINQWFQIYYTSQIRKIRNWGNLSIVSSKSNEIMTIIANSILRYADLQRNRCFVNLKLWYYHCYNTKKYKWIPTDIVLSACYVRKVFGKSQYYDGNTYATSYWIGISNSIH